MEDRVAPCDATVLEATLTGFFRVLQQDLPLTFASFDFLGGDECAGGLIWTVSESHGFVRRYESRSLCQASWYQRRGEKVGSLNRIRFDGLIRLY
jgi:hypothetical protein